MCVCVLGNLRHLFEQLICFKILHCPFRLTSFFDNSQFEMPKKVIKVREETHTYYERIRRVVRSLNLLFDYCSNYTFCIKKKMNELLCL